MAQSRYVLKCKTYEHLDGKKVGKILFRDCLKLQTEPGQPFNSACRDFAKLMANAERGHPFIRLISRASEEKFPPSSSLSHYLAKLLIHSRFLFLSMTL